MGVPCAVRTKAGKWQIWFKQKSRPVKTGTIDLLRRGSSRVKKALFDPYLTPRNKSNAHTHCPDTGFSSSWFDHSCTQ